MLSGMKLTACRLMVTALMALALGGCYGPSRYSYGPRPGYRPVGVYGHPGGWHHGGGYHGGWHHR